jgi:aspartyl-tRNA(Asn)/glutamyl-tRNA(Gln) amidotransferase subunit A
VLDVIAGADPSDATSAPRPGGPVDYLGALDAGVDGLRIGVARAATVDGPWCDPSVAACFEEAVAALRSAGAQVEDVDLPYWEELHDAAFLGLQAEAFAWHRAALQQQWQDYGRPTRLSLALGALISGGDYAQAQRVRRVGRRLYGDLLAPRGHLDALVLPTCGTVAPPFGGGGPDRTRQFRSLFTPVFNSLGFPALAVPMGFEAGSGLPTSLQIVAAPFEDAVALRLGHAYQQVTDWHRRVPDLAAASAGA